MRKYTYASVLERKSVMNFRVWKKIKKQLSFAKEKQVAIFRPKGDYQSDKNTRLETNMQSNNPPTESHMQQQSLAGDQATKPEEAESIQNVPIEENQVTYTRGNKDYILSILNDLPEQWVGKEMKLHVIVDRRVATWITKRIFQDVERGLINAQFTVEESNHLCDIRLVLKIAAGLASFPTAVTAINPVFSFILTDIKSETISRSKRKISQQEGIVFVISIQTQIIQIHCYGAWVCQTRGTYDKANDKTIVPILFIRL